MLVLLVFRNADTRKRELRDLFTGGRQNILSVFFARMTPEAAGETTPAQHFFGRPLPR
jgi:hypothetical protein